MPWSPRTKELIETAIAEDLEQVGDLTSRLLPDGEATVSACLTPRSAGVICGLALGPQICAAFSQRLGGELVFTPWQADGRTWEDGDRVRRGQTLATVQGPRAAVLTLERTLLNFLGRMSGVATLTRRFVDKARSANPDVQILDTRKTLPGWRELDKYAVRTGGGYNHRTGLYDAILIKDNHLAEVETNRLAEHLDALLRETAPADPAGERGPKFIQVEVDDLDQFVQVAQVAAVNIILLDNFTPEQIRRAIGLRAAAGRANSLELEASGGITLENVHEYAATGVDRISIGALTHSAVGLDLGLDL